MRRPETEIQGKIIPRQGARNKIYSLIRGVDVDKIGHPRESKVLFGVDKFGDFVHIPLPEVIALVNASLFPQVIKEAAKRYFDQARQRNALTTALKRKTAVPGYQLKKPEYRPKKVKGFMFKVTPKEIAKERKANDLKRWLREHGIDEGQLFLLLHSAAHSPAYFYKEMPRRPLPSRKRGGFMSAKEPAQMAKHRRRIKQILAKRELFPSKNK